MADLLEKTIHYWLAVLAAAIYVYSSQKDVPFIPRILRVIGGGLMGVSTGDEVSATFGTGEKLTTVAIIALGWFALDAGATLLRKHKTLIDLIRNINGGK